MSRFSLGGRSRFRLGRRPGLATVDQSFQCSIKTMPHDDEEERESLLLNDDGVTLRHEEGDKPEKQKHPISEESRSWGSWKSFALNSLVLVLLLLSAVVAIDLILKKLATTIKSPTGIPQSQGNHSAAPLSDKVPFISPEAAGDPPQSAPTILLSEPTVSQNVFMPTAAASHVGADENSLVTPEIQNGPTEAAAIPSNEATVSPSTNIMSTPAPTVQPVADSSSSNSIEAVWTTSPYSDEQISPEHYVIHTMYEDDLRYRRVCAPIGERANVCLTIRYPFEIPKQDPSVTYPKPVSAVFDDPDFALPLHIIDGMELDYCRRAFVQDHEDASESLPMSLAIKRCIDYYHDQSISAQHSTATACWTYERKGKFYFYGILASERQLVRMQKYFNRNIIIFFGMSPSPPIALDWPQVFGRNVCPSPLVNRHTESLCIPPEGGSEITSWEDLEDPNSKWTMIRVIGVLDSNGHDESHPVLSLLPALVSPFGTSASPSQRIKVTIVSEHPIAHMQSHTLLQHEYEATSTRTEGYIRSFLDDCRNLTQLDALNVEITNVIAFDGSPQFFPTPSGAYPYGKHDAPNSEEAFFARNGYAGWEPEYGSKCRGFLPPNSNLTRFNDFGRSMYRTYGKDMNWYGQTWEFINLVWYGMVGWRGKGGQLDCTHGDRKLVSAMHKFLLMAMVDNHYDLLAEEGH